MADQQRTILERTLGLFKPAVVVDFTPPLRRVADELWVWQRKIRLPGIEIPTHSTVLRLADGTLILHSPFQLDPSIRDELDELGPVAHLVAPNSFHYLFVAEHCRAFPDARVHLAPGLRERRSRLPPGSVLGERPPVEWAAELDQAVLGPTHGVAEVAFLHRASATLILTDLAFNMQTATSHLERWYWRLSGVWKRFGPTLLVRRVFLREPAVVRAFVEHIWDWDFDRIVVSHGDVVEHGGRAVFRSAFARYR